VAYLELRPVGIVEEEILLNVTEAIVARFPIDVRRAPPLADPAAAYDGRRRQYSSVAILNSLAERGSADALRVLGVTARDLFIPMLSFVFGQAQLNGRIALVSTARLSQEFYGLPSNRPVLLERAVKETMHELGHTFGLLHCSHSGCPMSLSTSIRQVDSKGPDYCGDCLRQARRAFEQACQAASGRLPIAKENR
jgi:archaemetzincin